LISCATAQGYPSQLILHYPTPTPPLGRGLGERGWRQKPPLCLRGCFRVDTQNAQKADSLSTWQRNRPICRKTRPR